jgi:hypothetical protein
MRKVLSVPYVGEFELRTCYGMPSFVGLIMLGVWAVGVWSRFNPPVTYRWISIEQVELGNTEYVVLALKKSVVWYRSCEGKGAQELRPKDAPMGSTVGITLEENQIKVPPQLGPYTGERPTKIYVPRGLAPPGKYSYFIRARMECLPWERWFLLDSEYAWADVTVQ